MDFESIQKVKEAKPDIGFFMYSPANWYPIAYNYPEDKKNEIALKRKKNKINGFVNYVNQIQPKIAIPYAGGILLPHKSQLKFNENMTSMFACPDEAKIAWDNSGNTGSNVIMMAAGDEISPNGSHVKKSELVLSTNKMEMATKLSEIVSDNLEQRWKNEGIAGSKLSNQILDYFNKIISENPIARKHIDMKVQLVAEGKNGGSFNFDITKDNNTNSFANEGEIEDWNYLMKVPAHLIQKAVNGELLWETLFLSCRWQGDRKPDEWNEHFINLLYDPNPTRISNIYKIYEKLY
jgi:UDP-MurNAc hydroxylase